MTYLETLLLIDSRQEKVLAQESRFLITNAHRYIRQLDTAEDAWIEDTEPGAPEKKFGKGGEFWAWRRQELDDKPLQLPEGT